MKRAWQIFVLVLAISSLLAPMPVFCSAARQAEHGCCASQAQLASLSCCQSDAVPNSAIQTQSGDQVNGELAFMPAPVGLLVEQQPVLLHAYLSIPPPILLPATILRT
jgi:hypothetical protein